MKKFFEHLESFNGEDIFNPWFCSDNVNDLSGDSFKIRRRQLEQYLNERKDAKYILLAEALGYQGGHFSGIPMTSERILLGKMRHRSITPEHVFSGIKPERTSKPDIKSDGFTEPTATIVWERLIKSGLDTKEFIFWNSFPWHPYDQKKGILSNRTPSDNELEKGIPILDELINITNVKKVIAIGEKARKQCKKTGIDAPTVRHPANGGAGKFREQIIKVING